MFISSEMTVVVTLGSPNWLNNLSEVLTIRSRVRRLGFLSMAVRVSAEHSIEMRCKGEQRAIQLHARACFGLNDAHQGQARISVAAASKGIPFLMLPRRCRRTGHFATAY